MIIREAHQGDLEQIVSLLADDVLGRTRETLLEAGAVAPCYVDAFAAIAADPNQMLLVADGDGDAVGTLQLSFLPGLSRRGAWRGQLEAVRVSSRHRGDGIGHQLVAHAIALCRARGCLLVQLTTDKTRRDAHAFYETFGFVASHEGMKLAL